MKLFQKPPLNSVRKKFAWLPRRVTLYEYDFCPRPGAEKIRFYPGWNDGITGFGMNGGHTRTPTRWPPQNIKQSACGGMVVPVEHRCLAVRDCWIWLEYQLEELHPVQHRNDRSTSEWVPMPHRKQWNLWHEYY